MNHKTISTFYKEDESEKPIVKTTKTGNVVINKTADNYVPEVPLGDKFRLRKSFIRIVVLTLVQNLS